MNEIAETKTAVHNAIQATAAADGDLEGAVLIGWVFVAEFMSIDGSRWLSRMGAPADPTSRLPEWQREGYLHNALHGDQWIEAGNDEGDDD